MSKTPEVGELVIGRVKDVKDYGAYVELDEYPGYEGFVHVSEVSLKWVRNIREHLKEGQKIVFKIIRANPQTFQADLSIRRVSQKERVEKLLEVKKKSKVKKVLKSMEERNEAKAVEKILAKTSDDDLLYGFFEEVAAGEPVSKFFPELNGAEADVLKRAVEQEIKLREVVVKVDVVLRCESRDGAKAIREAASAAESVAGGAEMIEIRTKGAPVYTMAVKATTKERAQELVSKAFQTCGDVLKKYGGLAELKQQPK
ncbi:MAG: S1 RNA-binding domain-containing protein [Candidatus Caldarchaeum sp.]|nr:S1 RNA-binding domain-containing protein [Candidatus Caldarchaeum sp.]